LVGVASDAMSENGEPWRVFDDGVFLSARRAACAAVGAGRYADRPGRQPSADLARVGRLAGSALGQIAARWILPSAQWRRSNSGASRESYLKLVPGADLAALTARLHLPPGVAVLSVIDELERGSNISLAYRCQS